MVDAIPAAFGSKSVFERFANFFAIDIRHLVMETFQYRNEVLFVTTWRHHVSYELGFAVVALAVFIIVHESAGSKHHDNIVEGFLFFPASSSVVG